jgi:hypothetical protein
MIILFHKKKLSYCITHFGMERHGWREMERREGKEMDGEVEREINEWREQYRKVERDALRPF